MSGWQILGTVMVLGVVLGFIGFATYALVDDFGGWAGISYLVILFAAIGIILGGSMLMAGEWP